MIVIYDGVVYGTTFGAIVVIVGVATYRIDDWLDDPPTAFTFIWYVPAANSGVVAVIIVSVMDVTVARDESTVTFKGIWAVL